MVARFVEYLGKIEETVIHAMVSSMRRQEVAWFHGQLFLLLLPQQALRQTWREILYKCGF
jgi:hypothetical protein